jgi:hypothetical protein
MCNGSSPTMQTQPWISQWLQWYEIPTVGGGDVTHREAKKARLLGISEFYLACLAAD